jgi:uncharacterized BrkB/YihY/UPF0761 family membrane protein
MDNDVGALDIKNKIKAAYTAATKNTVLKTAAAAVAPGLLNNAKNAALKQIEKVAPGAGSSVQNYVNAKETEIKNKIVSGYVITAVAAVAASYLLLRRK